MKKIILPVLLIAVLVMGGCQPNTAGNTSKEPIKIGFIGPLSGDTASFTEFLMKPITLALDEINRAGGVNGRQLELIQEEGKCNGTEAVSAAQKLVNIDRVKIIIITCSGETMRVAPITEAAKVVIISPTATSPEITHAGDYVFRNVPSDASSAGKLAEEAWKRQLKRAAVLSENTEFCQSMAKVFISRFTELGGKIVADEDYNSEAGDLRVQISKLKDTAPEAIFFAPQSEAKARLGLKQLDEMGLNRNVLTNDVAVAENVVRDMLQVTDGLLYAEPYFDETNPLAVQMFDKYLQKYQTIDGTLPKYYAAAAYDLVYILKDMLEKYGENTDQIRDGLYALKNRPGAAGSLTMDKDGDPVYAFRVKQIRNGQRVNVE